MKKQYDGLDLLKLLLSFVVVAIHCVLVPDILFPLARLAVPVFFILTGFFFFRKIHSARAESDRNHILIATVTRYLKLYGFWFLILLPVSVYANKYYRMGLLNGIVQVLLDILFGSTFPASWYLMACTLGIAVVYLISRKIGTKGMCVLFGLIYVIATACSEFSLLIQAQPELHSGYSAVASVLGNPYQNFLISLPYILLGKMLAEGRFQTRSLGYRAGTLALCLGGLALEVFLVRQTPYYLANCDCWLMLAPTALSLVLLVLDLPVKCAWAVSARNISTITYCVHYSVILIIREMLEILHVAHLQNVILFLSGGGISLIIALVILRLEKIKRLSWLRYSH